MRLNKRPALLEEAYEIAYRVREESGIKWTRNRNAMRSAPVRYLDGKAVAVPVRKKSATDLPAIHFIGNDLFDTTVFVGQGLMDMLGSRLIERWEDLHLFEAMSRVDRIVRNGHEIWRVRLVQVRKGKEIVMT